MNYIKIYNALIYKRQNIEILNKKQCYCEKHHIIPKSIGGNNEEYNLVNLTAREHYIAHLLLYKMYENIQCKEKYSMLYALIEMCDTTIHKIKYNSRIYEKARLKLQQSNLLKINGSIGGKKCWQKLNNDPELKKSKIILMRKGNGLYRKKLNDDPLFKLKISTIISNNLKKYYKTNIHPWKNKKHKTESKIKQRDKALNRNIIKDKNPMFGKIWIHNDILKCNKIVDKNIVLKSNWKRGRVMKYCMYKDVN